MLFDNGYSEQSLLVQVLLFLIYSGGAGVVSYAIMENVKALASIPNSWHKRLVSYGISMALGMGAYAFLVWLGTKPTPVNAQMWVDSLLSAGLAAMGISQLIHGASKLPRG